MNYKYLTFLLYYSLLCVTCESDFNSKSNIDLSLIQLERLSSEQTNLHFSNKRNVKPSYSIKNSINTYGGGGQAVGDINNDGLQDIVILPNRGKPTLYLNTGDFNFKDISDKSGFKKTKGWNNGALMVDINSDGFLDIYISRGIAPSSGIAADKEPANRANQLYINNKDNTFTESARKYGIANINVSIQALFFDFDLDGDLDLYVLNQPLNNIETDISKLAAKRVQKEDKKNSDTFYINNGKKFTETSEQYGITNWGYGMGIGASDINEDGFTDIYITNYSSMDNFLYLNNFGKGFLEVNNKNFKHQSYYPKGCDLADVNNDGRTDIFEVDLLPSERKRAITNIDRINTETFKQLEKSGFTPQYVRNSLQINKAQGLFSEAAQIANVDKTDWSWSTLLIDINDDEYKDILVTNGIGSNNSEYRFKSEKITKQGGENTSPAKIPNYAFQNNKDGTFTDNSSNWGFADEGFSKALSYGDFDNDGDLDLIVNNINEAPWIYKNNSKERGNNNINFKLNGSPKNRNGIGSKIKIYSNGEMQFVEQYVVRGFLSSSQHLVHFGLGAKTKIDSLEIIWPDKSVQRIGQSLAANKTHILHYQDAHAENRPAKTYNRVFAGASRKLGLNSIHKETSYDDYSKESYLPHRLSRLSPALNTGDVNKDGIDDIFIGSAANFKSKLYLSNGAKYELQDNSIWEQEKAYEDIAAEFFDADMDGDLDLYVCSGSNEFNKGDSKYVDRLYINDGQGIFSKSQNKIPIISTSTGIVAASDIDGDNDLDLFVGGRLVPGEYPLAPKSYILINENGVFKNATKKIANSIENLGMITTAKWSDFDQDGDEDLFVAGEWLGIHLFENNNGKLVNISNKIGLKDTEGWWYTIQEIDFDKDGDKDYICGNIGLNYKYKASKEKPFYVYRNDFDNNGKKEVVLANYEKDELYPTKGLDFLSEQMPFIKEKFPTYASFAEAQMVDIFEETLESSFTLNVKTFASIVLENKNGHFEINKLPLEAQISAITGVEESDFNRDGHNDLILAGNMYHTEVETSRADGNLGLLLLGDGKGGYKEEYLGDSGFYAPGDVKQMKMIDYQGQKLVLLTNNNGKIQSYINNFEKK